MLELIREMWARPWRPVPRWAAGLWMGFYGLFSLYAFSQHGGFLFIYSANLVVHEGGHLLFGWFGQTVGLWGGTLLQWLVPFLLATYFLFQRQTAAFVFCTFFFFENWLYTATYMADARSMALPLVNVGGPDFVEHDWNTIFSSLGLLQHDTTIASIVRVGGWLGMVGIVIWLGKMAFPRLRTRRNLQARCPPASAENLSLDRRLTPGLPRVSAPACRAGRPPAPGTGAPAWRNVHRHW